MKTSPKTVSLLIVAGLGVGLCTPNARALPAFSRKYQTSCVTCHEAFPRLNSVGESFRLNGFRFVDDESYIKDEPVSMGAEAYKRLFPKAIWPSDIPGLPPISMRALMDYNIDAGGKADPSNSFDIPHEVEFLAGGAFGNNVSFYAELEYEPGEGEWGAGAWITLHRVLSTLGGPENLLNVRVGNLGMDSFGPLTTRDYQRYTKEHYLFANYRIPGSANRWRLRDDQPGAEIFGFGRHWLYTAGVVEGDGKNAEKDFYGQLSYKIGGRGFDGSSPTNEGEGQVTPTSSTGGETYLMLSAFGYRGWGAVAGGQDAFWRAAFGALFAWGDLRVDGLYLFGTNDDPYGVGAGSVDSDAWMAQVSYFLFPWMVPNVRYESVSYDMGATTSDQGRVVVGVKMLPRANVAVSLEGLIYTQNDFTAEVSDANLVSIRVDFAF